MKTITKVFSTVFLVLLLVLSSCKDSELSRMPSLSLSLSSADSISNKTLRLNLKTTVDGTLRTVNISADNSGGRRNLNVDLSSLTWDNENNKPQIWAFVYDTQSDQQKFFKIKETEYNYYPAKDNKAPSVHILADIEYLLDVPTSQQNVRLYIFDKSLQLETSKFSPYYPYIADYYSVYNKYDEHTPILEPLDNPKKSVGYKILYSMVMPLQDIVDNRHSISGKTFSPVGTMILFSMTNRTGGRIKYPSRIVLRSNVIDLNFASDFDFRTAMLSRSTSFDSWGDKYILDNGGRNMLKNGEESYVYGIYTPVSNKDFDGDKILDISVLDENEKILNVRGSENRTIVLPNDYKTRLNGKFVSIPTIELKPYKDSDYTKLRFRGTDVIFITCETRYQPHIWPTDLVIQYRDVRGRNWINLENLEHSDDYRCSVSSYREYEVRFAGCYAFSVGQAVLHKLDGKKTRAGLREITQWGTDKYIRLFNAFAGCYNMQITTNTVPDLSICKNLSGMFSMLGLDKNITPAFRGHPSMASWNVSSVEDMSFMFNDCTNFNQSINNWNVSNVKNMRYLFWNCSKFNQPLDNWDVSNVENMYAMFYMCYEFNQPLNSWTVFSVNNKTLENMFYDCTKFNQPLDNWDVSNVENMKSMFSGCTKFNQPLSSWAGKLNKVKNIDEMFWRASSFDQDLSSWVLNIKEPPYYSNNIFDGTPMKRSWNKHPKFIGK